MMPSVLMVSGHCCIRVVKEGIALLKVGVPVQWMHTRVANPDAQFAMMFQTFYQGPNQFDAHLRYYPGIEVIHVHNTPDWIVWRSKEIRPEIPVIYDVHDMDSLRYGTETEDENRAFEAADGYVFVSEACEQWAREHHGPAMEGKPVRIIYSYCLEEMHQTQTLPRIKGLVYEGGIRARDGNENQHVKFPTWMDQGFLAQGLRDRNIPFYIYSSNAEHSDAYSRLGAMWMGAYKYHDLLAQLTRYDWGFCGCPHSHPQWEKTTANKLFEYIAAGIPVICWNAGECARIVEEHKLGVVIRDLDDLERIYHLNNYYRDFVERKKTMFTMERQVPHLISLYGEVLGCRNK